MKTPLDGNGTKRHYQGAMEKTGSNRVRLSDILRLVEESGLHDFPNPDRVGCPTEETLEAFARDPLAFSINGPEVEHLTHCSPCFRFVHSRRQRS